MLRFVLLEHDHPILHWDLMLEQGETLRTWRLNAPPQSGEKISATALPDHRRHYLDYEGPIEGNRGRVVRRDRGFFTRLVQTAGLLVVFLEGEHLRGQLRLTHEADEAWKADFQSETIKP